MRHLFALVLALASAAHLGCAYPLPSAPPAKAKRAGPPAHAPAHGYRHQHHAGVDLVFDRDIGVYVVVGHADHYYDGKRFYRRRSGGWEISARIDGIWVRASSAEVPRGLVKGKRKGKRKGRGPPAKHRY